MDLDGLGGPLTDLLTARYGPDAQVAELRRSSGGASRVTCTFDVVTGSGRRHPLVLRLAAPAAELTGLRLTLEAELMRAARRAGVPSPEVIAAGTAEDGPLGADFVVMERVDGETIPRRVLRDPALAGVRPRLAAECGRILAAVHRMPPVPGLERDGGLDRWRELLDAAGEPHPVLEFALRWLERNRPPANPPVLVHGDFRNGNLIIGPDGVRAVLDWELAHVGDPLEDLGWLCAKAWRFGSPHPVGGFGGYDDLVAAYEEAGGMRVDRDALHWWEMYGVLRWGVICIMQARRHLEGSERSVELAAIGRRVAENEWDLLQMMP